MENYQKHIIKPSKPGMKLILVLLAVTYLHEAKVLKDVNLYPDPAPFSFGVSSGDPTTDSVLLWTKLDPFFLTEAQISADVFQIDYRIFQLNSSKVPTSFSSNSSVFSGFAETSSTSDYCLTVEVNNLIPGTYYAYFFEFNNASSSPGRTKTLPSTSNEFSVGVISCTSLYSGYFHAYNHLSKSNVDLVLHLGDYIYPDADGEECYRFPPGMCNDRLFGGCSYPTEVENEYINNFGTRFTCEINELEKYRWTHDMYHLDPDLREARRLLPFVTVYDNHDLSYTEKDGENVGLSAFVEHVPVRMSNGTVNKILKIGDLVEIILLDTNLFVEDESLLGFEQENWVYRTLNETQAQWKIIASTKELMPFAINRVGIVISRIFFRGTLSVFFILLVLTALEAKFGYEERKSISLKACRKLIDLKPGNSLTNSIDKKKEDISPEEKNNKKLDGTVSEKVGEMYGQKFLRVLNTFTFCFLLFALVIWLIAGIVLDRLLNVREIVNFDGNPSHNWNGQHASLMRLFSALKETNQGDNNIFITGDSHFTVLSNVFPFETEKYSTLFDERTEDKLGVEFLPSSGTRGNIDEKVDEIIGFGVDTFINKFISRVIRDVVIESNPQFHEHESNSHGYGRIDINLEKAAFTVNYFPILKRNPDRVKTLEAEMIHNENCYN
eukprot:augustus_masked-scaffold_13-processed-gene-8.21-mRNA-1 protein AED:1.00 eAED:1.00 QI:0/-1/0/0/-1/1/1/0/666